MESVLMGEGVTPQQQITPRARLRAINDDIVDRTRAGQNLGVGLVGCECGGVGCTEALQIEFEGFELFRAHPTWAILAREHVPPGAEIVAVTERLCVIDERLRHATTNGSATHGNGLNVGQRTVLVVDDSEAMRKLCARVLRHSGHRVIEAVDGVEALFMARIDQPDLILTDIVMPRLGGMELIAALNEDPRTRQIRLIVMSGTVGVHDTARALSLGASTVIAKPFKPALLESLVAGLLSRKAEEVGDSGG